MFIIMKYFIIIKNENAYILLQYPNNQIKMTEYITPANIELTNNIVEEINTIKNSFEADPNNKEHKANYVKLIKIMILFKDIDDDEISKRVEAHMIDEAKQEQEQEQAQEQEQEQPQEQAPDYFKIQNNFMIEKNYDDITEKNNFRRNFEFTILEDMEGIILCVQKIKN